MEEHLPKKSWKKTLPLLVVGIISAVAAFATSNRNTFSENMLMIDFMGFFFLFLATFKFFDLPGFARGFSQYDVVAKRFSFYAYAYPFLELLIACLFLSGKAIIFTAILTVILMAIGVFGVLYALLSKGKELSCACMGSVFSIPLTVVTVVENVVMGVMAFFLLF